MQKLQIAEPIEQIDPCRDIFLDPGSHPRQRIEAERHQIVIFRQRPRTVKVTIRPIRRLGLAAGESAEISVGYIDAPNLEPRPVRQRYHCIQPFNPDNGIYRYEALFRAGAAVEIEVDSEGLVIDYPGGFNRVWTG